MIQPKETSVDNPWMTVFSNKKRTANDLLHRALAHINYDEFDVGKLTIFEDPAIAVFNMFPKLEAGEKGQANNGRLAKLFHKKREGILLSVNVSSLAETNNIFSVSYVVEMINSHSKSDRIDGLKRLPETLISQMFNAIPDVLLVKTDR